MEVQGIIKAINQTEQISDRFKKREFVLTVDPQGKYPQHVLFQLTQDKCSLADDLAPGQELRVQFNLRGKEWNSGFETKYFNTLEAWRIEKI